MLTIFEDQTVYAWAHSCSGFILAVEDDVLGGRQHGDFDQGGSEFGRGQRLETRIQEGRCLGVRLDVVEQLSVRLQASDATAYISPVKLDDIAQTSPHIPPGFKQGLHWEDIRASGVERVALNLREAYRNYQRARSEGR